MIDEDYYQKLFNVILSTSNGLIILTFTNYLKQCLLCEHVVESVVFTAVYMYTCLLGCALFFTRTHKLELIFE